MVELKQKPYAFYTQKVNQPKSTRHYCYLSADLPCCHGAAAKPAATPVPNEPSISFSNSWVTCRFSSRMKGTTSPARHIDHWSWRVEGNERLTQVPGQWAPVCPALLPFTSIFLPQCPSYWLWPPNPVSKTRGWQTMAHRTNPAPFLFMHIKFYWNIAMPICLWIVKGYFCVTLAELNSCYRDHISCKA